MPSFEDKLVRINAPILAPLSPSMDTTSDQLTAFHRGTTIPFVRHSPLPVQAQSASGAAGRSISQTLAQKAIRGANSNLNQIATSMIKQPQSLDTIANGVVYGKVNTTPATGLNTG